jgi:hypothetical protein
MNLESIKKIVNTPSENWEMLLLKEIAEDNNAIWHVLTMLAAEREKNNALITEINFELSRAHLSLSMPKQQSFVYGEIMKFYKTGKIKHCYKMEGLE